ncbi:MAG: chorismate mutase [Methylovulum sp.]|nr:chorismate mutase [Methylovulum sp.]
MSAVADEIWAILRGLAEAQTKTEAQLSRTDEQLASLLNERQETAREIKAIQQETAREIKAIQQETAREIKAVNTSVGRLSNRLGEFVEEAVRPAAVRLFRECGLDVHEVQQNIVVKREGESLEIDLFVVNDKDAVAIECKSNLSIDDVNEHLQRLEKMKRLMPRYQGNQILGAVAGMVIPEHVAAYAIKQGLYVIGQTGEQLGLRNDANFVAKAW